MATTGSEGFEFPNPNVPDSKKDGDYHKQYLYAILNRSLNGSYDLDYASIETCQDYYQGVQASSQYDFLQSSEDGSSLPAFWVNYQKIRPKIDLLTGEIIKKGWRVNVRSTDKISVSKKLESRNEAKVDFKLQPYVEDLESNFGIPLKNGNNNFESEEEIDDYFDYDYKEKSEVAIKSALDYSLGAQRWDYERLALFRDLTITGRCFSKCELINGVPKARRIDPKFVIFDRDATDDFLTDSTFFGEIRYMSIAEAAQQYDVTKEQLLQAYNSQSNRGRRAPSKQRSVNDVLSDSSLSFFNNDNGELRVLVTEAYWVDYKKYNNRIVEDNNGNIHVKTLNSDTNRKKNVKSNFYKIWRKALVIGGDILIEHGEVKNMPRSIDDPSDTGCPYQAVIPNYINYSISSIVQRLQPLQDLKNIAMYNLQLAMARAGSKGFVYDTAQVPEGWDVHEVLKYLKVAGIAFINSMQNETPTPFNQFQKIDLSLGEEVNKYIEISVMADREMDAITGINEARQGLVQNSSQAVGVTQSALIQSSLTTEVYFEMFRQYSSSVFNYLAGLIKIAWVDYKDRYSMIIGDSGVNFLIEDLDLDLQDYAMVVEDVPASLSDEQNKKEIVSLAVQNQSIKLVSALRILKEKDIDRSIRMLEAEISKTKREEEAAKAAEMEAQVEAQQAQLEAQQTLAEEDRESKMNIEIQRGKNSLMSVSAEGKTDLFKTKMNNDARRSESLISKK